MPPRGQHPRTARTRQPTCFQPLLDLSSVHPYRDQRGPPGTPHGPPDARSNVEPQQHRRVSAHTCRSGRGWRGITTHDELPNANRTNTAAGS